MHHWSMNWISIGSGNGLSSVQRKAIAWTYAELLSIGPIGTNFSENLNQNSNISIQQNAFENVVCMQHGGHPVQGEMS